MTDLDQNPTTQSPKRKFSFRFPHLSHSSNHDRDALLMGNHLNGTNALHQLNSNYKERKNFCEEAKNVPDLQVSFEVNPHFFLFHYIFLVHLVI